MREIKFRGKEIETNEWVYGWVFGKNFKSIIVFDTGKINKYGVEEYWTTPVDPETVGQYTGRKDYNGKEIYEGDIINRPAIHPYKNLAQIVWNKLSAGFDIQYIYDKESYTMDELWDDFEIVGNIYENPELLEVE